MSLTILEVLENAEYNLKNAVMGAQTKMGIRQLSNALYLINEKDKGLEDTFNEDELKQEGRR